MRLHVESVGYFKALSEESGIPYQTLINPLFARLRHKQTQTKYELDLTVQKSIRCCLPLNKDVINLIEMGIPSPEFPNSVPG